MSFKKRINSFSLLKIDKIPTVPQWEKHWTQCYNIVKNHDSTYNANLDKTVNNIITTIMIKHQ